MRHIGSWLLSGLLSLWWLFGYSFATAGDASFVLSQPWYALIFFALMLCLCYGIIRGWVGLFQRSSASGGTLRPAWQWGLLLFVCWLPYYAFTFPGVVSSDSVTQMKQLIEVEPLTNANPITQTLMVGVAMVIGKTLGNIDIGIMLYVVIQAMLMAWLLGSMIRQMTASHAPKWLWLGTILFFALNPIFPLYAFCVGKDTNFAMAVTWHALLIWQVLHGVRPLSWWNGALLCLSAVLCTLLRNVGLYVALITLTLAILYLFKNKRRKLLVLPACAMVSAVTVYAVLHFLFLPVLQIPETPETENYSLPLQQVARVVRDHDISDEDLAALEAVMDVSLIASSYDGELSDAIKNLWVEGVTSEQRNAFFNTWLRLATKYPLTSISATFHNTFAYLYPSYVYEGKPTLLIGRQGRIDHLSEAYQFSVNENSDTLQSFADALLAFFPTRLLIAPGLYGCLCLFSFLYLIKKKDKASLIAATPVILTLIGCFFSAVNGYFRYAMPLYLLTPFILWLCTHKGANQQ